MFVFSLCHVKQVQNLFRMFRICSEFSVMFRICSEFSVMFRICSEFSVMFSNVQTLFRISNTKTGLFRISWLCSVVRLKAGYNNICSYLHNNERIRRDQVTEVDMHMICEFHTYNKNPNIKPSRFLKWNWITWSKITSQKMLLIM
jgi:hypothetical protein